MCGDFLDYVYAVDIGFYHFKGDIRKVYSSSVELRSIYEFCSPFFAYMPMSAYFAFILSLAQHIKDKYNVFVEFSSFD